MCLTSNISDMNAIQHEEAKSNKVTIPLPQVIKTGRVRTSFVNFLETANKLVLKSIIMCIQLSEHDVQIMWNTMHAMAPKLH